MAILFNIILYVFGAPLSNIILFWIIPPFLGTFQLFYFWDFFSTQTTSYDRNGATYIKNDEEKPLSCYAKLLVLFISLGTSSIP